MSALLQLAIKLRGLQKTIKSGASSPTLVALEKRAAVDLDQELSTYGNNPFARMYHTSKHDCLVDALKVMRACQMNPGKVVALHDPEKMVDFYLERMK